MILRIRNFEKFQGHVKHDWPWRKIWRTCSPSFAKLPCTVRGFAWEFVLAADKRGDIDIGDDDPVRVLKRLLKAHDAEVRTLRRVLRILLADGFVLAINVSPEQWVSIGGTVGQHCPDTGSALGQHSPDIGGKTSVDDDSTQDPKFRQIRVDKIREEKNPQTPKGGSQVPFQVFSGSTAAPEGMTVQSVARGESPAAKATREAKAFAAEALAYLSERAGRSFGATDGRVKAFKRLLSEGRTLNDVKVVVWSKCLGPRKWLGDEKMDDYVTPETLFRASNFTKYWEQAVREYVAHDAQHAYELGLAAKPEPKALRVERSNGAVAMGTLVAGVLGRRDD